MWIAIIGTGIAGLTAAHLLRRRHDLTLFEAGPYAGGHTHTASVEIDGRRVAVDTGFIVFNPNDREGRRGHLLAGAATLVEADALSPASPPSERETTT